MRSSSATPGATHRYREFVPAPDLRPDIECLWMVWDTERRASRPADRVVPDGCPEIIIHLEDPFWRRLGGRWVRQPRAFLAGTLTRPWLLRAGVRLRTLGIRFRPGAITRWFDLDMRQAADREVPLRDLLGRGEAREWVARIQAATTTGRVFAEAERLLLARPARTKGPSHEIARAAVRAVLTSRGRMRIDDLASRLKVSPRRLERAFARNLGLRPKLFSRIVRLNAALALLAAGQRVAAVDWALESGYFDQAHLARDFRSVAGRRARAARDADGEMARHFTDLRRLIAYLDGA